MQDVAPGRTIGGRYTLNERRLASADGVEAWSATDAHLQAEVTITLLDAGSPPADAVLDAARRAAHVQDHRLVRILDVGEGGGLAWIVEEHHPGARALIDLVEDNPLSGEATRTVVGEAASALAVAGRRGLHHLRLTPYSVLVTDEGDVKVSGLGTVLALDGAHEPPRERADLLDALGLLALAYYAMTTRWPLPGEVPGVLAAPRVVSGVPAPSEIAAGVPADLDMLCRTALNGQAGPAGPAQLAREIAPWRPSLADPSTGAPAPTVPPAAPSPPPVAASGSRPLPGDPAAPAAPAASAAGHASSPTGPAVVASVTPDGRPGPEPSGDPAATSAGPATGPGPLAVSAAKGRANGGSRAAAVVGAAGAAGSAAAGAAGETVAKLGSFARAAADKAQLKREQAVARRAAERQEAWQREHAVQLADLQQEQEAEDATPVTSPLWPFPAEERPGAHSRFVLAVIAAICVLSFGAAAMAVMGGLRDDRTVPAGTATQRPGTTAPGTAATSAPRVVATARPVAITAGSSVDPDGDGSENDSQIPRAYDGNAATRWASEQYYSDPGWGGSANRGVGLAFKLADPVALQSVRLSFGSQSQTGSLYVGPSPRLSGATKVAAFTDATGTQTVALSRAPRAAYVIVWFTKAPMEGSSRRVALNEIVPLG